MWRLILKVSHKINEGKRVVLYLLLEIDNDDGDSI